MYEGRPLAECFRADYVNVLGVSKKGMKWGLLRHCLVYAFLFFSGKLRRTRVDQTVMHDGSRTHTLIISNRLANCSGLYIEQEVTRHFQNFQNINRNFHSICRLIYKQSLDKQERCFERTRWGRELFSCG
jgi:hypothetical protein